MNHPSPTLTAILEAYRSRERELPTYDELVQIEREISPIAASPRQQVSAEPVALTGKVCSATPGMGRIEIHMEEALPEWLDPGYTVRISPADVAAHPPAEAAQEPTLQPIETAPRDGREVLLLRPIRARFVRRTDFNEPDYWEWIGDEESRIVTDATHWMPPDAVQHAAD